MDDDQDDYVGQLREVFDRCDTEGTGLLNRDAILELCKQLQLEDNAEQLIGELLGDSTDGLVDFETFKEAFVLILSTAVDFDAELDDIGVSDLDDDDRSVSSYHNPVSDAGLKDEVSPKYVRGNKKYGRRSKPDIRVDQVDTADISDVETDVSSYAGLPPDKSHHSRSEARGSKREGDKSEHGYPSKRNSVSFADDLSQGSLDLERELDFDQDQEIDGAENPEEPMSPERVDGEGTSILETFEAEGQNNASTSLYAGTPTQDQTQVAAIEAIWEEVGVGKDGFLDIDELKIVCEHIGMDDMDNEELDNLFHKLDEDHDGRVSFDEFLQGLFSHTASATPTPIPIGMSPAQRANLRRLAGSSMDDPYQRTATPSLLVGQYNKLFSMLDPNNSGYARPEDISEQLEVEGIENPNEIMEILDINMEAGKVSLMDLSSRLENILLAKGDDDGVYQVALATYQGELKFLRSQLDIVTDERDHLKDDITEANHRNTKLAQEVDDRHNNILRQNEKQLQALEDQYQDKIVSLQAQVEKERESLTTEEAGVRESLAKDIEQLKADDALSKEKVLQLQKENGRLEEELVEATERLIENEKTIQKQQRDLEGFQELEERLADLESNRESVSKHQEEYFESNIKEYQEKIRLLQDKMDELTQENDLLKNQGTERKTRRRTSKIHSSKPGRIGSVLSDYVNKPNIQRRLSSSDEESELAELDPALSELPARSGGDGTSNEDEDKKKLEEEREKWESEMTQLKEDHKKEIAETRIIFEHECKDIEEKYKIEIAGLEEDMELKKDEARTEFDKLRNEFKKEQSKLVEELERRFKAERTETQQKTEREKHSREEEVTREKADLRDELEAKYNKELDNRITELKQQLLVEKRELENLLTKEKSDVEKDLLKAKNEAEMKLKQRELDFVKEKGEMESEFGKEKSELLQNYNAKVHELEEIFINGEAGLKGQLREDFNDLLDRHKTEMEESYSKEREELRESHDREKEEMNHNFELERAELLKGKHDEKSDHVERLQKEKAELVNKNKKDKLELFEKHRREKAEMMEKFKKEKDALNEKHKKEKAEWDQKLQKERERFRKEREDREEKFQHELAALELNLSVDKDNLEHTIRMDVEDKIRQDLKTELESDYVEQMHRLQETFEDEKSEFITEKEEMEDRLRATSANQVETAIQPMVAQQVHRPMPIGGMVHHAKTVSVSIQTSTDSWMEEKKDLEKRLQKAQALANDLANKKDLPNVEYSRLKEKFVDEDSQTEGVEMVDNTTSTTLDKEVDDDDIEVEPGTIDNIQKFFTGLFKDGPRAKGVQTEVRPFTERISQTDINGKYFQQKFILEQKLRDTEALSDEMVKTIQAMTYTEKEWQRARGLQQIDEYSQTDTVDTFDKECFTDRIDNKVQETMTNIDVKVSDDVPIKDETKVLVDAQTMTDEDEKKIDQLEAKNTEMLPKKPSPKDNLADLFAKTHLEALQASKKPKRQNPFLRDQNPDEQQPMDNSLNENANRDEDLTDTSEDDISSVKAKVKHLEVEKQVLEEKLQAYEKYVGPLPLEQLQRPGIESKPMEGMLVSTEVQTSEDLLDSEVALAKRMEREWMEEKKRLQNELRDAQAFMFKTPQATKNVEERDSELLTKTDEEESSPNEEIIAAANSHDTQSLSQVEDFSDGDVSHGQTRPPVTDNINEQITLATRNADEQSAPPPNDQAGGMPGGIHVDIQTVMVETVDTGTSTSQDKLTGDNASIDGVVDANAEVEVGTIDNIQKFFTGLFSDGPRAKGIQTESKPITERISQTDIGEKYFKEKEILEQKLKDSNKLADEMSKSLHSMAMTDKAWEAAKQLQSVDGESQTDMDHVIGHVSVEEVESLKAQVTQLEAEKEVLGEKLRASKALSEVMAASMQITKTEGTRDKTTPDGLVTEQECEVGTAENFHLRLFETDEGELETVKIPTGRFGGHSRSERPQQQRRSVSDDMKELLQDFDDDDDDDDEYLSGDTKDEYRSNDIVVEETMMSAQIQASEFSMPKISQLPQVDKGTQTTEGEDSQSDSVTTIDCGVMVSLIPLEDESTTNNAQSGPDDKILRKDVISISPDKVKLNEDGDGNLQANSVKSGHQKSTDISREEILKEFTHSLEDTIDADEDIEDDGKHKNDEQVQEETLTHEVTQPIEFQMPHMPASLQKEQGVQVDLLEKDTDSTHKSQELGPEGAMLKKSVVDVAFESFELNEDDNGNLQRNQAKTHKPLLEEVDKEDIMKEFTHSLEETIDADEDIEDDGKYKNDEQVQEKTLKQEVTQPTKFQMPHMPAALQKEQGVQVDLLDTESKPKSQELGPEGSMLKKSVVDVAFESFELNEDDNGNLQRNQAKIHKPLLEEVDKEDIMKEFTHSLEDTIDADEDIEDDGKYKNDEQVQEKTLKQEVTQPTKFQIPHMPAALQKEQGVQVDLLDTESKPKSQELGPEGSMLKKSVVDVDFESFELNEDDNGNLQRNQAKTRKPILEDVDKDKILKEMTENFGVSDVDGDVNEWGFSDTEDEDAKMDEIKEESVTHQQVQLTKFQMPQMKPAIQKEQQVQVDILCSEHEETINNYKSKILRLKEGIEQKKKEVLKEFERVRQEFKAEQARVVEEIKEQFEEEKAEADQQFEQERRHFEQVKYKLTEQLESSPAGDMIQKDEVGTTSDGLQLVEDEDGYLQAGQVKSTPSKAVEEITLKEMVQNLESINDADKDDDEWEHVDEDGVSNRHIQEESCIQQKIQLTEFSMPNVASALTQEQATQVDILVFKPPDQFGSKFAQTDTTQLLSKEMQTIQHDRKDMVMQTLGMDMEDRVTQTDNIKMKEIGIQLEILKLKNQSSQWEVSTEKVAVQTISNDARNVKIQTEHSESKEKGIQSDKQETESKACQWTTDTDQLPISKPMQTEENHIKNQTTQTANMVKALTETRSVQVKADDVNDSSQTDVLERKDKANQIQRMSDVENKSCQWESSYIRTKSIQTEDRDQMSIQSQTDDIAIDNLEDKPFIQYHVSIAEQSVPGYIENATQASQTEILLSDTGTSMETAARMSRASQVNKLMTTSSSSQWEKEGDSLSMSVQTDSKPRILSGIQTEERPAREQSQQASVEQVHTAMQHQVEVQHGASQTSHIVADVKATQTMLLTENQKLQTDQSIRTHRGSQSEIAMLHDSSSQAGVISKMKVTQTEHITEDGMSQTDSNVKKEGKVQTDLIKSKSVDANTQVTPLKRIEKENQADLMTVASSVIPSSSGHKDQHAKPGALEEKAVKAEMAREEAMQISSVQQLHAAHQDTSGDKSTAADNNEEQTLTFVSSMDEESSETEGPDEILSPRPSGMSDSTLTPSESSEGDVIGMLRKTPFVSSFLPEKKTRPKRERRRKRDRVRKLPDIPDQSRKRRGSVDEKYHISDETSGEDIRLRRSKHPPSSYRRQLPTPPGSDSAQQEQPKRNPKISDIKEKDKNSTPQRTHGELSSQDSLFSRLFPRRDSKVLKDIPSVDEDPPLKSSSVTFESAPVAMSAPPPRPADLRLTQKKPSNGATDDTRVTSPLTEQVTSQKDKLTQMLNLFRPDVKTQEQSNHKPPQRSTSLPSMPEEEFLHKKATTPLEAPRKAGDAQTGFELHPSSSPPRLYRQKPSDGQDAEKYQRSSSLPGQIDNIKRDRPSQVQTKPLADSRLKSSASDPRRMEHERDGIQHTGVGTGMLRPKELSYRTLAALPNDRALYEALALEQGKLAQSVQGLEMKFNQSVIGGQMTKQARIEILEQNCDRLKQELSENGKKLLEAEMQVSIMEAQHMRELQRLKDKHGRETETVVSKLKKDIAQKDNVVRELENALSMKAEQIGQAANRSKDELNQEVKEIRDQRTELEKKYRNTQRLLDEYMRKLKEQLTRSTRSDVLVKELYVENSKLQKALQVTEERQKIAERNCHNLREKNHAYLHVLRRIAPAAM